MVGQYHQVITASSSELRHPPDLADARIGPAHIDEGAKAIMANRADKQLNFDILRGQTALCKEFIDTENTKGKPMGWQSPDDWKKTIAMMAEAGQAKADANIDEFFTNDLIKS